MFSEASGHNVVVPIAAGKCSFLVGVDKIETEFIQICLENITGNTAGLCCSVLKNHSDVLHECRFTFNIHLVIKSISVVELVIANCIQNV